MKQKPRTEQKKNSQKSRTMSNQVMSKQKRIGTQQRNKITPTHSHLVNAKQISKKKVKQKN